MAGQPKEIIQIERRTRKKVTYVGKVLQYCIKYILQLWNHHLWNVDQVFHFGTNYVKHEPVHHTNSGPLNFPISPCCSHKKILTFNDKLFNDHKRSSVEICFPLIAHFQETQFGGSTIIIISSKKAVPNFCNFFITRHTLLLRCNVYAHMLIYLKLQCEQCKAL